MGELLLFVFSLNKLNFKMEKNTWILKQSILNS